MNHRPICIVLIVLLIAILPVVACGGGGVTPTPSAPTLTPTAAYKSSVTYAYDNAGRLIQAEYANGLIIKYTYDKGGNLIGQEVTKK